MNLMNAMILSCVKATALMEMKDHVSIGFVENMQLHIHTAMCSGCRNYMKQNWLINELLQNKFDELSVAEDTDTLEANIIAKLL